MDFSFEFSVVESDANEKGIEMNKGGGGVEIISKKKEVLDDVEEKDNMDLLLLSKRYTVACDNLVGKKIK